MLRPLALLLFLPCLGLPAQSTVPPIPLRFLGFEAGASLETIGSQVKQLGGRGLHCDRARRDRTVQECRATVFAPGDGHAVALWLSAIDSSAGILTLSGPLSGVQLADWKRELETSYGVVDARVQGVQWMQQWVRAGRMLRLTWRVEGGAKMASVSLVDGRVLDGWGQRRQPSAP